MICRKGCHAINVCEQVLPRRLDSRYVRQSERRISDTQEAELMKRIRRILCATDFSPASRPALDTALALAKSLNARLTIVSVLAPVVTVPEQYIDAAAFDQLDKQAHRWSMQKLERLARQAAKRGVRASVVLRDGDPADQIVRSCRAAKSDLIVVGTHGRRGLSKMFLGSVAERVIAAASCPVVTVRSK
jgi:nucleotide-binding universal stress UspA family protein